jgi:glucose/arabinose dehydrogenase
MDKFWPIQCRPIIDSYIFNNSTLLLLFTEFFKRLKKIDVVLVFLGLLQTSIVLAEPASFKDLVDQKIKLQPGFHISIFADNVPGARQMAFSPDGIIFVGTADNSGKVFGLRASADYAKSLQRFIIADGLNRPNGVAYQGDSLYIAEVNRISRYQGISKQLAKPPEPVIIYDQLPSKSHHGMKYLRFGPDGKLYTGIGAPCNICKPEDKVFATLVRLQTDGSDFEIIAHGIRNTVGFDWQPGSDSLFFTDNGRDYLGDDLPPEELNQVVKIGAHFGFPFCHGSDVADPEFGIEQACKRFQPPVWKFKAHMAPLGMRFYRGTMFPKAYRGQLLVALHGSWNRSQPHGYQIALVRFEKGQPVAETSFIEGWLLEASVLGRPVDILELPDGSILISDDYRGVIYRVTYQKP